MTAQKITAPGLVIAGMSKSFVLKILPVTHFDSRFCKDERGSAVPNLFISKILQQRVYPKNFRSSCIIPIQASAVPLCVE